MRKRLAAITFVAIAASIVPSAAQEANTTLGLLDCNVEGGMGFIIGSQKNLTCTFTSANKADRTRKLRRGHQEARAGHWRDEESSAAVAGACANRQPLCARRAGR